MHFIKQILVTLLVLAASFLGLVAVKPEIGRAALNAGVTVPPLVRDVIVSVAPEAGEAPPEVASGPGRRGPSRGGIPAVARPANLERSQTQMRALASAEALRTVAVHPDNTSGPIEAVLVTSGQSVEAGAPLVSLERAIQSIAVERARLNLRSAEDRLQRYRQLAQRNATTSAELSDIALARDAAALDLRQAEIELAKRIVRAPISGRIGIVSVEPGMLVDTATTIATIDDRSRLKMVFYLPERSLADIGVGTMVEAVPVARPESVFEGRIAAIDSRVDPDSRTIRTEAVIDNTDDALRPGMSFSLTISLEGSDYLATDPLAVVWERDGPFVWKVTDGKATKAPVRIVQRDVDRVLLVSKALSSGDLVVVEGIQSMRDGAELDLTIEGAGEETGEGSVAEARVPSSAGAGTAAAPRAVAARDGVPLVGEAGADAAIPVPQPADRSGS